MADNMAEIARATVTIVPNMAGSQATIKEQLTGVTDTAAEKAGESGGAKFGEKFGKALKATSATIGAALTAATGAVVATGKAFVDAAGDVANYGDSIEKQSQKVGLSMKSYQEWDYVMTLAGTSMQNMQTGLKTLTNKLDDAKNGGDKAQQMFAALGLSLDDLQTMTREEIFEAAITGFQGMADSTERAALANDLFGRSGQELTPLFNMTAEETKELIANANELGMVMSDDAVKASAGYVDSLTTLQNTMSGVKNTMIGEMLPGFTDVANGLALLFGGKDEGIELIKGGLESIISKVTTLAPVFFDLASSILSGIVSGFAPMLPGLITAIFTFLVDAIGTVSALAPQLVPVLTQGMQSIAQSLFAALPVLMTALTSMTIDMINWLAGDDNVKLFIDGIFELVSLLSDGLSLTLPVLLPAVFNIFGQVVDSLTDPENIMMLINSTLVLVGAVVMALVNSLPEIGGVIVKFFMNIIKSWEMFGSDILGGIKDCCIKIWDAVKSWFSTLPSKIKTAFQSSVKVFTDFATQAKGWGADMIAGLWNGLNDKMTWIKERIKGMGSKITEAIKGVFGIHSPSRVMRDEVGKFLAEGIGVGFSDEMDNVADTMASNANLSITSQVTSGAASAAVMPGGGFGGSVTINVNAAPGQSAREIAREAAIEFQNMLNIKGAVYA